MKQTIGNRIQVLRKQHGMSQQKLSEHLNITRQTISKWEADQSLPDLDALLMMSELFDVSIAYILCVEEDNKSISQMYELMQIILNNQQKTNKLRNVIQIITILLCVLSLGFNISMRHKITSLYDMSEGYTEDYVDTNILNTIYAFTKDQMSYINNNPYVMEESAVKVTYYDFKEMKVALNTEIYLSEYNSNTTAILEFYAFDADPMIISLKHQEGNLYTSFDKLPIDDYQKVLLKIDDGMGNIKSSNITENVPHNYLMHALFSQVNLFVPLGDDGKLQLNQIEFDPTYYNNNSDNRYMGYLDGTITIRIYTKNKKVPTEILQTNFKDKTVFELDEKLSLNQPVYFEFDYNLKTPNSHNSFSGTFGHMAEDNGTINHFSFIITNTDERVRIMQMPIAYSEELDMYYFKNKKGSNQ